MRTGDWFLRVDADEFHEISPPEFVETHLASHETIVYHQYYDFRLLQTEVDDWEAGRESLADRSRPISERRRWFTPSLYSEPRLCRYRETMQWPPTVSFPYNAGYVARKRLPIRHYPHRDPVQLERRCRLRAIMMADKENSSHWTRPDLHHWAQNEWRKFITPNGLPELQSWKVGDALPDYGYTNHLRSPHIRLTQRLVHDLLLPILDARRTPWQPDTYPQKIPVETIARLERDLR
jgi:hypothetical protein